MSSPCKLHTFGDAAELARLRALLLQWYDRSKRDLPWRAAAAVARDDEARAYAVWVSEVMLQQTQVATVKDYYTRWMRKWPTVQQLSGASLEEVREVWSGLGYYSRGERLWQAAKQVVQEMEGHLPHTAEGLARNLPGVGRYTAGAIASIAFGQVCGAVDGNVVRVLSRLRAVAAEVSRPAAVKHLWSLADSVTDPGRPGDFNEALMELGALVCSPRRPLCHACPLADLCHAHRMACTYRLKTSLHRYSTEGSGEGGVEGEGSAEGGGEGEGREGGGEKGAGVNLMDIESCALCLSEDHQWDPSLGEANFPRKARKKPARVEHFAVGVVEVNEGGVARMMLRQRPETGLLAGLWEFPCTVVQSDWSKEKMWTKLIDHLCLSGKHRKLFAGELTHQFTHIHHRYHVWHVTREKLLPGAKTSGTTPLPAVPGAQTSGTAVKWVDCSGLKEAAISTAVRKIHKLVLGAAAEKPLQTRKRHGLRETSGAREKRQRTMDTFLSKEAVPSQTPGSSH